MSATIATRRARSGTPAERQERRREDRQQHHVLAGDRQDVSQARAAEVVADRLGNPVVLPEHEPTEERGRGLRRAALERRLGAAADLVERAAKAATHRSCDARQTRWRGCARHPRAARAPTSHGAGSRTVPLTATIRPSSTSSTPARGLDADPAPVRLENKPGGPTRRPGRRNDGAASWACSPSAVERAGVDRREPRVSPAASPLSRAAARHRTDPWMAPRRRAAGNHEGHDERGRASAPERPAGPARPGRAPGRPSARRARRSARRGRAGELTAGAAPAGPPWSSGRSR